MKRRFVKIALLLGLGALLNVAVAWGFAVRRPFLNIERNSVGYFVIWGRPWQIVVEQRLGMTDVWWYDLYDENPRSTPAETLVAQANAKQAARVAAEETMMSGGLRQHLASAPAWGTFRGYPLAPTLVMGGDIAFGFPLRCLWMNTTCDLINQTTANDQLHGGWLLRGTIETRGTSFTALPYRIIWLGFIANTIFYAAMLWAIAMGPFELRRRLRRSRGLCESCAYPVGISPVCTECGKPISSPSPR